MNSIINCNTIIKRNTSANRRTVIYIAAAAALIAGLALSVGAPGARAQDGDRPSAPQTSETDAGAAAPALAPVQLDDRRRQLIGVQLATVIEAPLVDRIDTTGAIVADERLQGYVQTRFAGWIRRVFVDQTYQYVRRGQPLFTIYSPDLANTEREYLLARGTPRAWARARLKTSPRAHRRSPPPRSIG